MKCRVLLYLLLLTFLFSCNENSPTKSNVPGADNSTGAKKCAYKRYAGTVAGQPVIVNLHYCMEGSEITEAGGNYYYPDKSQLIGLSSKHLNGSNVQFEEYVETEREEEKQYPKWNLILDGANAKGVWETGDGKMKSEILLREDYTDAYPFDVVGNEDSIIVVRKKDKYVTKAESNMLTPSESMNKADAAFIIKALLHVLGGDTLGATSITTFESANNRLFFDAFKNEVESANDSDMNASNWDMATAATCEFNDKGIVIFRTDEYSYSGGAHGNNYSQYICIDVHEKKLLQLSDILRLDTPKINQLLEQQARKAFNIDQQKRLGEDLLVDTIPPTNNVTISRSGIVFHYNPYEIASYVDGDVSFFISYSQLGDMLTPWFRKRMGL